MKYTKKPIKVTVKQWTGKNYREIIEFIENVPFIIDNNGFRLEAYGNMKDATVSDYIIKGDEGYFYPCKESIFYETYRHVCNNVWEKKPVTIEAIDVSTIMDINDIVAFCGDNYIHVDQKINEDHVCNLLTLEGVVKVMRYDVIVKGVRGEFYPTNINRFKTIYIPICD